MLQGRTTGKLQRQLLAQRRPSLQIYGGKLGSPVCFGSVAISLAPFKAAVHQCMSIPSSSTECIPTIFSYQVRCASCIKLVSQAALDARLLTLCWFCSFGVVLLEIITGEQQHRGFYVHPECDPTFICIQQDMRICRSSQ